ncbi:MAG TPA: hypothetical protein VMR52_03920 [Dehalococcoidia bacterium]|nr:hypothetical protein [Dehalococcoidia bacterium]
MPVFVDVIQEFEPSEHFVPVRISSIARLTCLNRCLHEIGHTLNLARGAPFEGSGIGFEGERSAIGGNLAILEHELPCQVVKCGSEVLDTVTNRERDPDGRCIRLLVNPPEFVAGINVAFRGVFTSATFGVPFDGIPVGFDVLLSPLHLRPNAFQFFGK